MNIQPILPAWMQKAADAVSSWFGECPEQCRTRVSELIAANAPALRWKRRG